MYLTYKEDQGLSPNTKIFRYISTLDIDIGSDYLKQQGWVMNNDNTNNYYDFFYSMAPLNIAGMKEFQVINYFPDFIPLCTK